jgi:hypothetical protein
MKRIADDEPYYFQWSNENDWQIGLYRVLFGTRVIIDHPSDKMSLYGNFCGGCNPEMTKALFMSLFEWLNTNPVDVKSVCDDLRIKEKVRPFGNDEGFMKAIAELPKKKTDFDFNIDQFKLKIPVLI